jgi:hypothetical protein
MWNPFKKNNSQAGGGNFAANMMAKVAMKKIQKMSPQERNKMMQEAFKPENKNKLLSAMEMMKKSGQISEEQMEMAKKKLGL